MEPADSALPRVYGQTVESSGQSWDGFLTFVFSSTGLESMWCLWSYGRRETIPLCLLKASKNVASNLKYFCLTPQTWVGSCSRFHITWLCLFSHLQCLLPRLLCFLFVQAFVPVPDVFNHDLFVLRETQPLLLPCGRVVLVVVLELCLSCVFCSCVLGWRG